MIAGFAAGLEHGRLEYRHANSPEDAGFRLAGMNQLRLDFLVLILLSVLVGFALFSGARSALNYLSRSTIQPVGPDYSLACCWPTNDGIVNAPVASTSDSSLTSWVTVRSVNNFSGSVSLRV